MRSVEINGNSRAASAGCANLATASFADAAPLPANSNYILIETTGPLDGRQKQALKDKEVTILEYKGKDIYLCGYKPPSLENITNNLDFVTDAEVYHPSYVVEPDLRGGDENEEALVEVCLHDDVAGNQVEQATRAIASQAGIAAQDVVVKYGKAKIKVPKARLNRLAWIDEVKTINQVRERRLCNNVATRILDARRPAGLGNIVYKGKGQVVCVADTGFDTGDRNNCHHAFRGRVRSVHALGRARANRGDDPDGHGTHVCGSVLGNGTHVQQGTIEGAASESELIMQSVFKGWRRDDPNYDPNDPRTWEADLGGIPDQYRDLFGPAFEAGARIHTNSWSGPPSRYIPSESGDMDGYLWNNKKLVALFAAGNAGRDVDSIHGHVDPFSISAQASAKNCITVGASESKRPGVQYPDTQPGEPLTYGMWRDFPYSPQKEDPVADNPEGLAAFSSRGPTRPGNRIKPDVVAPGTTILSARSSHIYPGHFRNFWGESNDEEWCYEGGTSMATPLTAGCCAVIRGALEDNDIKEPSAALVKAILINGAVALKGQYNQAPPNGEFGPLADVPNSNSGFGRVNLNNSLQNVVPSSGRDYAGFGDFDGNKALGKDGIHSPEYGFPIIVPRQSADALPLTLKITLVWADRPGELLQADLDLIVKDDAGTEKHGNQGDGPEFDRANNVEQVVWKNVKTGATYHVIIRAYRTTVDPQPFAYAWRLFPQSDSDNNATTEKNMISQTSGMLRRRGKPCSRF